MTEAQLTQFCTGSFKEVRRRLRPPGPTSALQTFMDYRTNAAKGRKKIWRPDDASN